MPRTSEGEYYVFPKAHLTKEDRAFFSLLRINPDKLCTACWSDSASCRCFSGGLHVKRSSKAES